MVASDPADADVTIMADEVRDGRRCLMRTLRTGRRRFGFPSVEQFASRKSGRRRLATCRIGLLTMIRSAACSRITASVMAFMMCQSFSGVRATFPYGPSLLNEPWIQQIMCSAIFSASSRERDRTKWSHVTGQDIEIAVLERLAVDQWLDKTDLDTAQLD